MPATTLELVGLRTRQINGCGTCVYGHPQAAKNTGETEERLATVAAWRERADQAGWVQA